jgi:hypothetical protein
MTRFEPMATENGITAGLPKGVSGASPDQTATFSTLSVKTRNPQSEQMFSAVPRKRTLPSAPVFRSDPLHRRGSNAKLLSNLQVAGPILSPDLP